MKIVFKDGYPVSDFGVEGFYETNKNNRVVFVSSILVLYRFRVAAKAGDIPTFDIEVYDGEELYLLTVDRNGRIKEELPDILNIDSDLLDRLLW